MAGSGRSPVSPAGSFVAYPADCQGVPGTKLYPRPSVPITLQILWRTPQDLENLCV